eukprot:TRINITY_DN25578_c0_g1_i1.p1 TRINITY_DN25578_c0_g1~~TRINITY_DN25578_c0_g1_i1.p1  ORF type:complete len:805 (+),score=95.99 TRINITY_DN25578_c0_g1_i1:65-2416(+)
MVVADDRCSTLPLQEHGSVFGEFHVDTLLEATLSSLPVLYTVDLCDQSLCEGAAYRLAAAIRDLWEAPQLRLSALCLSGNRFDCGAVRITEAAVLSSPTKSVADDCCDGVDGDGECNRNGGMFGIDARQRQAGPLSARGSLPIGCPLRLLDLSWNRLGPNHASGIARALRFSCRDVIALNLNCNEIGNAGALALAATLPSCRALRRLLLLGNRIGGEGVEALAGALPFSPLEQLEVSQNYAGPRGATALATALRHKSTVLLSLHVSVNRLGDIGAGMLADALAAGEGRLDTLDMGSNRVGDIGAKKIAQALSSAKCSLRCLGLGFNRLTDFGLEALAQAVESEDNLSLQSIDLSGIQGATPHALTRVALALRRNCRSLVPFDPLESALQLCIAGAFRCDLTGIRVCSGDGAHRLAMTLSRPGVRVRELALSDARLGDTGVQLLGSTLLERWSTGRPPLEMLDLSWNVLGPPGIAGLASALRATRPGFGSGLGLLILDLECNSLGDAGVAELASSLGYADGNAGVNEFGTVEACSLRVLRLGGNRIGESGAEKLAAVLKRRSVCLVELELGRNQIGHRGASALASAIALLWTPLRVLGLSVNRLRDDGAAALSRGLLERQRLLLNLSVAERAKAAIAHISSGAQASEAPVLARDANRISDDDRPCVESLRGTTSGFALDLSSNFISNIGALSIAELVRNGPRLESLGLEYNQISGEGGEALAAAIRARHALVESGDAELSTPQVRLAGNRLDGGDAELALQEALDSISAAGTPKRRRLSSASEF